jgi:hypothetical protein
VTDAFDAVSKELAFLQLESDAMFHEDIACAFKQLKQGSKKSSPKEDVINDDATAKVCGAIRVARAAQSLPFITKDLHHASVKRRGIARAKRHHRPAPFRIIGREEGELLLVTGADTDLMVACLVIEGDEEERASGVAKIIDCVVAARDRVLKRESDLVQTTTRDTEAPSEVINRCDVFLMRLGSENNRRTPRPEAFPHPTIGF